MLRASREEAQTDALTGLGNRRALARALERELPRATRDEPLVLVLFDLDGFKHYNDTFGHPAGDALLVRLGGSLAAFLRGRGSAFRMGGDEFCALLSPGGRLARRRSSLGAAAALSEHGEGFEIGCSYGAIELPARGRRRRRGAADRRPAHVRAEERRPHVGQPPEQGRAAARARRAQPRAARPPQRRRRPRRGHRAAARDQPRGSSSRCATPPSCTTSARSPCPTRSSPSPARSTRTSGRSSAATR